ncbi:DUF6056 family protein [Pontibacter chinhatensis]|uniref:4-amino-4-deoxy-L-arabinose transferase n=1 Tax=Pontibacter chinhatensis TaxID=1436961 RepID=A0A1I2NX59_9BACT|nr:DUF6056 family protein [Pontibacter chinhatensis]SFG07600.1 hypothetical protein SAMN05421739_101853 [Pontibacter chinhatensis]
MSAKLFQKNKGLHFSLILLGAYCLLPFLLLALYAYPQADDYPFGLRDKQLGFWESQVRTYSKWSGRYFGTAILRINPLIYDSIDTYPFLIFVLVSAVAVSFIVVLYYILRPHLRLIEILGLASVLLAVYLMHLPSTAEGMFWLTGFLGYTLPNILFLFILLLLYKLHQTHRKSIKLIYTVAAALIGVLIAGANEMAMLCLMSTLLFILSTSWFSFSSSRFYFLVIFIICLAASLAATLAPGNFNRMESHSQAAQPLWSLIYAGLLTISTLYKWTSLLLILSLLYVYSFGLKIKSIPKLSSLFKVSLPMLLICIVGTVFLMNFLFVWATGDRPTLRLQNVIFFYLLISWFYALQVFINQKANWFETQRPTRFVMATASILVLLTTLNINNNISTAYLDLLSGKAAQYKSELRERDISIARSSCQQCIVEPLSVIPASMYFISLQTAESTGKQWVNREYAAYWGKESVVTRTPNATIQDNYSTLIEVGKKWRNQLFY